MHTREISVPVTQPFDLGLSVEFLRGFSPMMGEVEVERGVLKKTWLHEGVPVTVTIREGLACALSSPSAIGKEAERAIAERVAFFLSAGDDVEAFYRLAARDEAFAPVAKKLRGLHHPKFPTPFECLCWGLVNQRIPLAQARKLKASLVERFGAKGAFPEPKTLAKATEGELASILKNERKARAVFAAAQAFAAVDEKWLQTAPIDEVEAWLRRIWGVGDFTVAFVLYRGLGRSLPPTDPPQAGRRSRKRALGLPWSDKFVEAAKKTYGRAASRASLTKTAAAYGPWVGYWSLYLWASTFVGSERRRW